MMQKAGAGARGPPSTALRAGFVPPVYFSLRVSATVQDSKARQIGELLLSAVHVHRAVFSAAVQGGHRFARIQERIGVKRSFYPMKHFKFIGAKLDAHLVDFLDPHAVLASDGSTHLDTQFQDFGALFFGFFQLPRLIPIEQNERVQVAVPGVEHIGTTQPVFF